MARVTTGGPGSFSAMMKRLYPQRRLTETSAARGREYLAKVKFIMARHALREATIARWYVEHIQWAREYPL